MGPLSTHDQTHIVKKEGHEWVELLVEILPSWVS
jgi:hypothetical protein